METLYALSPLDGRYASQLDCLRTIFSEYGLIRYRLKVEVEWFLFLSQHLKEPVLLALSTQDKQVLLDCVHKFNLDEAKKIKEIESITQHDVKAIEYYLKDICKHHPTLHAAQEFIHFAATSEDINNLAYAFMIQEGRIILCEHFQSILNLLKNNAHENADIPMLSRTHGQSASPTTVGKEFSVMAYRLNKALVRIQDVLIMGKINGAVGNWNAHHIAYPALNWPDLSRNFVQSLGFEYNPYTTQIESHDKLCELLDAIAALNQIMIDCARDIWGYISLNYLTQKTVATETGSSTMPHKVNPIDFENAEGNCQVSTAVARMMSDKLPISRFQRDLTDSTVMRNLGLVFGHSLLAAFSFIKGLKKIEINRTAIMADLHAHPEVLAEAIQTVMRKFGSETPYEKLKELSRGKVLSLEQLRDFIESLPIPHEDKINLKSLTPENYLGSARELAKNYFSK